MAARRLVSRCASLWRINTVTRPSLVRAQSIFTKEREPPNGFLFNEKVKLFQKPWLFELKNVKE